MCFKQVWLKVRIIWERNEVVFLLQPFQSSEGDLLQRHWLMRLTKVATLESRIISSMQAYC